MLFVSSNNHHNQPKRRGAALQLFPFFVFKCISPQLLDYHHFTIIIEFNYGFMFDFKYCVVYLQEKLWTHLVNLH